MERIKKAVNILSEHFDTVHVFCTNHPNNAEGTRFYTWGAGNFYARKGQIQTWLEYEKGEAFEYGRRGAKVDED